MDNSNFPEKHIAKDAITVWRISAIVTQGVSLVVLVGLLWTSVSFEWYQWIHIVLWIFLILDLVSTIWTIGFEPVISQKYWRYGVNKEFIALKHGYLSEISIIIPMTKVQYVNVKQGPLLRKYHLSTLTVGTIRTDHEIPAISEDEAKNLRNEIARLAKIKEVE